MPGPEARLHLLGLILVIASAATYSTAGFFTRLIEVDVWTLLFWRGVFAGLFVAAVMAWRQREGPVSAFRDMGWPGIVFVVSATLGMIFFINAFRQTTVADVAVVYATAPFVAAGLAWAWTGERASRGTLIASAVALFGVVIMVGGAAPAGNLLGVLLAFGMTLSMAIMMVIIRRYRRTPMIPAACLSLFLSALVTWPLATPGSAGATEIVYLAIFGVTQLGLGLILLTLGVRLISAAEAALIGALETPLAPLWVWLAFGEVPLPASFAGGAVVMLAVLGHILVGGMSGRPVPRTLGRKEQDDVADGKSTGLQGTP